MAAWLLGYVTQGVYILQQYHEALSLNNNRLFVSFFIPFLGLFIPSALIRDRFSRAISTMMGEEVQRFPEAA